MNSYGLRTGNPLDKRLYEIWRKMHYKCENPKYEHYSRYGGQGINVCEEWNSFVYFASWAIQNGYADNLTLGRINNDGNYEPSNCIWVTMKEQAANRNTTTYKVNSRTFSIRQRNKRWEYRIEAEKIDGKRKQISKCGFETKEAAIQAASDYIENHVHAFNQNNAVSHCGGHQVDTGHISSIRNARNAH